MTAGNTGHTAECRYYETGNFKDCDCKEKEEPPKGQWAEKPFLRLDAEGNVIERDGVAVGQEVKAKS